MHPIIIKQRTSDDNYRNLCPNYTVIVRARKAIYLCILYDGNDEVHIITIITCTILRRRIDNKY